MTTAALTDFLLARIAEDEAAATDAAGTEWFSHRLNHTVTALEGDSDEPWRLEPAEDLFGPRGAVQASPARVLAECAAKRAIARAYESADLGSGVDYELGFGLDLAVRALAAVYSDHPDYRAEWA